MIPSLISLGIHERKVLFFGALLYFTLNTVLGAMGLN